MLTQQHLAKFISTISNIMRQSVTTTCISLIFVLCMCLTLSGAALASTYWVSPTGAAANLAACSGSSPLNGTSACSRKTALAGPLSAGDTVYFRAGNSTGGYVVSCSGLDYEGIKSPNNGSAGNPITFAAYNGETVVLTQANFTTASGYGVNLSGNSYIRISGITFKNFRQFAYIIQSSHHNEITGCTFTTDADKIQRTTVVGLTVSSSIGGSCETAKNCWNTHNWIHGNTFS
jgi:hypothetical protein